MGTAIVWLVNTLIDLITFLVIVQAVLSWLIAFEVINTRNRFVSQVLYTLDRIVDPMLAPIRRVIPNLGGIDITPIILLLGLKFIQIVFDRLAAPVLINLMG